MLTTLARYSAIIGNSVPYHDHTVQLHSNNTQYNYTLYMESPFVIMTYLSPSN